MTSYIKDIGLLPRPQPKLSTNVLDLFSLKGKVCSVTGSSTGIGYAVAEAFAQAGGDVAIWYNSHNADEKAKKLAEKYGVRVKAYKCNIVDAELVESTIKTIESDFGTIDVFVCNAGIPWTDGPSVEAEGWDLYKKVVDIDLNAVYYCSKIVGQIFQKQGHGSLILTASMSGHIVNVPQLQAPYNAVKAAVLHLGRSLAVEWAGFARVNTISPGYMLTDISEFVPDEMKSEWHKLIPMGREGQTQELVGAYLYLASNASTYTTGSDIIVDGGYCAP